MYEPISVLTVILTLIFGQSPVVGDPASRLLGVVCLFVSSHSSQADFVGIVDRFQWDLTRRIVQVLNLQKGEYKEGLYHTLKFLEGVCPRGMLIFSWVKPQASAVEAVGPSPTLRVHVPI